MTRFLSLLLLGVAAAVRAQVSISVRTEGGRREYATGENIVVDVFFKVNGEGMNQQTPLRLFPTQKFEVLASGSEQNTVLDDKTGTYLNETHYQTVLRAKKPGSYKIGSVSVMVNDRLYYTEPFEVNVTGRNESLASQNERNPVSLKLTVNNANPYLSQPTVATLTAYSKNVEALQRVHRVNFPASEAYEITDADYQRREVGQNDGQHYQVLALVTIVPAKAGSLTIGPVSVKIGNRTLAKSNGLNIKVKPVPELKGIGRLPVGRYAVTFSRPDGEELQADETFKVHVSLTGEGNLEERNLPMLKGGPSFTTFPPVVRKKKAGPRSPGSITAEYVIRPTQAGPLRLETLPFSYFDPEVGKLRSVPSQKMDLEIGAPSTNFTETLGLAEVGRVTQNLLGNKKRKLTSSKREGQQARPKPPSPWLWVLATAAVSGGVLYLFRKRRRRRPAMPDGSVIPPVNSENVNKNLQVSLSEKFAEIYEQIREEFYSEAFLSLAELDGYLRKTYQPDYNEPFETVIERKFGRSTLEKYRRLLQRLEMERQAPEHSKEEVLALADEAQEVYLSFK